MAYLRATPRLVSPRSAWRSLSGSVPQNAVELNVSFQYSIRAAGVVIAHRSVPPNDEIAPYDVLDSAGLVVFDFIESFCNSRRRHTAIGFMSPVEFERRHMETAA